MNVVARTFDVDERVDALLTELQQTFGVNTGAEAIRKALALASIASEHAASDGTITISGNGRPPVKVSLAG